MLPVYGIHVHHSSDSMGVVQLRVGRAVSPSLFTLKFLPVLHFGVCLWRQLEGNGGPYGEASPTDFRHNSM